MILSMTGYGDVHHAEGGVAYALEVRSLNNRYFKVTIKLPEHLTVFEGDVEKLLRARLTRGSVTYTLRVRDNSAEAAQDINIAALHRYVSQLSQVPAGDTLRIDLAALLALPGVCQPPEISDADRERQWKVSEALTAQALDRLLEMRRLDGRAVRDDLVGQCERIRQNLARVAERAPVVLKEYHQRLIQRANNLLNEARLKLELDDVRREVALYAERCDINEEIARLGSHLDQFATLCDGDEVAGRKLDFLAQELLREANTIGSKANDATIAQHIVEIKASIDRLKEQVQNVE